MSWLYQQYRKNINGIIFTLLFHLLFFVVLNITQFRVKKEYTETEMIIEFPDNWMENLQEELPNKSSEEITPNLLRTNIASNRAAPEKNRNTDDRYLKELEEARRLVSEVSRQLSKEIPTINDLQMPEETSEGLDPDSLVNQLYSGTSNIEYFLENRFHIRLPIPVYLAQTGGKVKVLIEVNQAGKVVRADPVPAPDLSIQVLSYAKTAAFRTVFNPSDKAPGIQNGYIEYTFITQ